MNIKALMIGIGLLGWAAHTYPGKGDDGLPGGMRKKKVRQVRTVKKPTGPTNSNRSRDRLYIPEDKKTLLKNMYHDINGLHKKITVVLYNLEESKKQDVQFLAIMQKLTANQEAITSELKEQSKLLKMEQECIKEQGKQIVQLLTLIKGNTFMRVPNSTDLFSGEIASGSKLNEWIGHKKTEQKEK